MRLPKPIERLLYPAWYLEAREVFERFGAATRELIRRMDADLAAMGRAPALEQGADPWLPAVPKPVLDAAARASADYWAAKLRAEESSATAARALAAKVSA